MSKWKPALALLLVFVAGLGVGVVGTGIVVRRTVREMVANPQIARERVQVQAELQLARRLRLGPLQRPKIRQILSEMQGQLKLINQETQPRRAQVISNAAVQIDFVLNPQQKLEFEKLKAENRGILQPQPLPPPLR